MIHFQHPAFGLFRIHLQLYLEHMLTFICYIEVYYFSFAFLDCVCYNEDFIKLRFVIYRGFVPYCLIVILAGLKKIVCHTKDFVIWRFVKSRFYCQQQGQTFKRVTFRRETRHLYPSTLNIRVFIRHQSSENSLFTTQNSLTNTWQLMTIFYSDMEPLSKYSPVTLHLSPSTRILNENPAISTYIFSTRKL